MEIIYDNVNRKCVSLRALYKKLNIKDMKFSEWVQYMKDGGLDEKAFSKDEDGVDLVTTETAKTICRFQIYKIADEHDCFEEIFDTALTEEAIELAEYETEADSIRDHLERVDFGLIKYILEALNGQQ